ncbi:MAG: hypothetical protein WC476_08860 [Phycisphaerae bacterium]|jgi:hypothetical protein
MIITVYEKETKDLLASIKLDGDDASVISHNSIVVELGWEKPQVN